MCQSCDYPKTPADMPPVPGARKAPDGYWYLPDPTRPGKYLRLVPLTPAASDAKSDQEGDS
jgi:hypothetical protein